MGFVGVQRRIHVNAIAFREGDAWVAQGLEYDIVAQANDVLELPAAFTRAVAENICITEHLGRKPLEGIKPAPDRFRAMWETGTVEMRPTETAGSSIDIDLRVAA